jgi:hypothetical protein
MSSERRWWEQDEQQTEGDEKMKYRKTKEDRLSDIDTSLKIIALCMFFITVVCLMYVFMSPTQDNTKCITIKDLDISQSSAMHYCQEHGFKSGYFNSNLCENGVWCYTKEGDTTTQRCIRFLE